MKAFRARHHANGSPPSVLGLIGSIRHQALDGSARSAKVNFVAVQHLCHDVLALSDESEEEVFRAHVRVAEANGLVLRQGQARATQRPNGHSERVRRPKGSLMSTLTMLFGSRLPYLYGSARASQGVGWVNR